MVCIHRRFLNPRGVFINSGEHSFSAQSLIKRQGARRNGPPSHPSLLKIRVGAATRSTSPKALDQFSHIFTTMSVRGECWEIEYYSYKSRVIPVLWLSFVCERGEGEVGHLVGDLGVLLCPFPLGNKSCPVKWNKSNKSKV